MAGLTGAIRRVPGKLRWPARLRPRWPWRRPVVTPVLPGYFTPRVWQRKPLRFLLPFLFMTLILGMALPLFYRVLLLQMLVPALLLAIGVVVALPNTERPPWRLVAGFSLAAVPVQTMWPNYLAVTLPGLPWITLIRLVYVPLTLGVAIAFSISPVLRARLGEVMRLNKPWFVAMAVFYACVIVATVLSSNLGMAVNQLVVLHFYIATFAVLVVVFQFPEYRRLFAVLCVMAIIVTAFFAVWEARLQDVVWKGRVPGFLTINDPILNDILGASARVDGRYRTRSTFSHALTLAEFHLLLIPFVMFMVVRGKAVFKLLGIALTMAMIWSILLTDSRFGRSGAIIAVSAYAITAAAVRWRGRRDSIMGPAFTFAVPVAVILLFISSFFVGRIGVVFWGYSGEQASTDARKEQWAKGNPMIVRRPYGFGLGVGGGALDYRSPGGQLTIDSGVLRMVLDVGVLGSLAYYGAFAYLVGAGSLMILRERLSERSLLIPLCISVIVWLIVRTVFAQIDNDIVIYSLAALFLAELTRLKRLKGTRGTSAAAATAA